MNEYLTFGLASYCWMFRRFSNSVTNTYSVHPVGLYTPRISPLWKSTVATWREKKRFWVYFDNSVLCTFWREMCQNRGHTGQNFCWIFSNKSENFLYYSKHISESQQSGILMLILIWRRRFVQSTVSMDMIFMNLN